jgi:hypothetical protein
MSLLGMVRLIDWLISVNEQLGPLKYSQLQYSSDYFTRIVVKALGYKPEGGGFDTQSGEILNLPNPSSSLGPRVHSTSKRNECWKH